ncbi:hypothetical protein [Paraburkholderia youngii]|uniref:hypothetical protein n=1 Tax=Paraburkholderia youngii TaxID=2782701 RepID=UPI003D1F9920
MDDAERLPDGRAMTFFHWFRYAQGGTKPLRVFCVLACFLLAYRAVNLALIWRTAPHYDVMLGVLNFFSVIVLQIIAISVSYCFYRVDRRSAAQKAHTHAA